MQLTVHVSADRDWCNLTGWVLVSGGEDLHGFIGDEFDFLLCDWLKLFQGVDYGVDVRSLT
jgi:hypothetical protein